jgi:hypothetical protein
VREQSPGSGIETLDVALARRYLADGTFVGGVAPKMESIVRALEGGAKRAVVCGSGPGALSAVNGNGTVVVFLKTRSKLAEGGGTSRVKTACVGSHAAILAAFCQARGFIVCAQPIGSHYT